MGKRPKDAPAPALVESAAAPDGMTRMKANVSPESTLHLELADGSVFDLDVDAEGFIDAPAPAVGKLLDLRLAKHVEGV